MQTPGWAAWGCLQGHTVLMMAAMAAETALSVKIACATGMFDNMPTPPAVTTAWVVAGTALATGLGGWAWLECRFLHHHTDKVC